MPKNKRNKVIALTKTKKTNFSDKKSVFIQKVIDLVDEFEYTYTFSFKNLTTLAFQSLRTYFREEKSVFLMGKNTVMQVALGKTEEEAYKPNMHLLAENLRGNSGLFFSNKEPESIIKYFEEYTCPYFPSPGFIAKETIIIKRGCPKELKSFPSSMEETFRNLGLKFKLDAGKWYVLEDYVVSEEGKAITPEQTKFLRVLDYRIDEFRIKITSYNTKKGEYKLLDKIGYNENIIKNPNKGKKGMEDDEDLGDEMYDNEDIM